MAQAHEMTPEFARWYAQAFMDEGPRRKTRWQGVVNMAAKVTHITTEVLVRLAFQTKVPATGRKSENLAEAYQTVVSALSGGDTTFDPAESARELQILSAAALDRAFLRLPDTALAVTTTSFSGARKLDLPMDLVGSAEDALAVWSGRKHERVGADKLKIGDPKIAFEVPEAVVDAMEGEQLKAQFDGLRNAAAAAVKRVVDDQNRINAALHRRMLLDEEELQMLWWLIGGHSRLMDQPFQEIDPSYRPFALAHELATMTAISPGPASVRAMLSRSKVGLEEMTVQGAVNAASVEWAKSRGSSDRISPATTPIHFALEQRSELASTDTWQAGWEGLTNLSAGMSLPAVKLAELYYREYLYLHVGA